MTDTIFAVGNQPIWTGGGAQSVQLPDHVTWDEARTLMDLDWDPVGHNLGDGWQRITRGEDGPTLAYRPESYAIRTNTDMGQIMDTVMEESGAKLVTGGQTKGGRVVWAVAQLDEPIQVLHDPSKTLPYLGIFTRHDGLASTTLRAISMRTACSNIWGSAETEARNTGATFSFKHRGDWEGKVEEARKAIRMARTEIEQYTGLANDLARLPISKTQRELFVREFAPLPPDGIVSEQVRGNVEEVRGIIRKILDSPTCDGIADTAYGLVQAAGEYYDHARPAKSWESRLGRTLLRPEPFKAKAVRLAYRVANDTSVNVISLPN